MIGECNHDENIPQNQAYFFAQERDVNEMLPLIKTFLCDTGAKRFFGKRSLIDSFTRDDPSAFGYDKRSMMHRRKKSNIDDTDDEEEDKLRRKKKSM